MKPKLSRASVVKTAILSPRSVVVGRIALGVLSGLTIISCSTSYRDHAADPSPKAVLKPESSEVRTTVIRSDYAEGEIKSLCQLAMDTATARLAEMVAKADTTPSLAFDRSLGLFESINADLSDATAPLTFMGYVSPVKARRDEASACEESVGKLGVEIFSRKDIYAVVRRSAASTVDQKRLLSETLRGFKQGGLELPDQELAQLRDLKKQITTLQTEFSKNLNEDKTSLNFSAAELAGCSSDFLGRHKQATDGKYIVFANEADYPYVEENAKVPQTREALAIAYNNRAPGNTELLEKTILLREQAAKILKYKNWADAQIDGRMAVDSAHVYKLLNELKSKLSLANRADLKKLLVAKRKLEDPRAKTIEPWDISYFANQLKKSEYHVDDEVVRTYFPKDVVVAGLFHVYSTLLGVTFEEVANASVWNPDVKMFAIRNTKDKALIGYFFTDFFPREGKYGHAAAFPLLSGRTLNSGAYSLPVAAIVANLTPPSDGKPALLSHNEVETIFHEFGHIMHQTLTRAPYASLSGSSVAQDFVEAPSQMLENWVWERPILDLMSGLNGDPSKHLPPELLTKMIAARDFNQGYFYTRQLMLALTDMDMHSASGAVDVTELYNKEYHDILGIQPIKSGHFAGTFGHLMGGYDAGYYGYLWSEVYAADMFTVFRAGGLLSPEVGARYRTSILENGRMKDANILLEEFLGRPSNSVAFYKKLHIK